MAALAIVPEQNCLGHLANLVRSQLWKYGQAEELLNHLLSTWYCVSKRQTPFICRLAVYGYRIVNQRANAPPRQKFSQGVSMSRSYHILVVYVTGP